MSRAWRLLLPAIAGIVFVSGAEAPFTLHAPILTDINQIDETPIDRSLVVDLTFPELATHLQGASVTMTWEGMMPILVAAEAADVRAKLLADEIMRLVSGEEELQKIGGFLAPETDERDQLVENLAVAVDRRSHLLSLPPIPPCRRFGEERANGPWNEECRFRREFRQNEISRLERSISDFEARLDISQRALEEQANTYRAILAASDEGARLLAYRRDAYAKAQEVSQTRVISLLVVGLIAISAITVPKIGWAVGVVAVAVGAQIWMLPAASGWARFEPFVHFATFAVPFMIARLIHDAIVTNWPLLRLSRPAEWWSALKLMAMRSVWIVVGAGLLFSASFYLDKYSGDILYGLQVRPNISNIDVVAGCTIGETLVFRQPTLEGCAVRRSESDIEASIDWRLAEGERQALLRIDEKANDASSTTAQIGEATISAFDDFVPRFLAADQGGSGNNESYVSTGFNKWNCSINPFKWLGCLVNKMLAPPRNGYVATYENARNKLLTHVTTAVEEANGDIEVARATMKVSVRQSRIEMQENTHQAINTIFRWLDVIGLAAIFIFTLTVLRLFGLCCTNQLMAEVPLSPDRVIP